MIHNKLPNTLNNAGLEVLIAVVTKSSSFWDISLCCSPLKVNRRFGRTYPLHFQVRRIRRTRHRLVALFAICFQAGIFVCLFFDPENGGNMFLRNVVSLNANYISLYPKRWYFLIINNNISSITNHVNHFLFADYIIRSSKIT
jgi:hypothetical protein